MLALNSESVDQLAAALAEAQAEFPRIKKEKTAKVRTRSGDQYTYQYADIADVIDAIRSVLAKHGLSYTQQTGWDELPHPTNAELRRMVFGLHTYVLHKSGQWLRGFLPLPELASPQELGSALTYMRRYGLTAALGVAAEEDDDGQGAEGEGKRGAGRGERSSPPRDKGEGRAHGAPGTEVKALAVTVTGVAKLGAKGFAYNCKIADGREIRVIAWGNVKARPGKGDQLTVAGKWNDDGELVASSLNAPAAPSGPPKAAAASASGPSNEGEKQAAPAGEPPPPPEAPPAEKTPRQYTPAEMLKNYKVLHTEATKLGMTPPTSPLEFAKLAEADQLRTGKALKNDIEDFKRSQS